MNLCVLQLLKTQDELERLQAEKETSSSDTDERLNELQRRNSALTCQLYDQTFCSSFCIIIVVFLSLGQLQT